MIPTAKIFQSGNSQAVRLPKEFRLAGERVHIKWVGRSLLLTPQEDDRWEAFMAGLAGFSPDLVLERDTLTQPDRVPLLEEG
jgi:antitoxin VapB